MFNSDPRWLTPFISETRYSGWPRPKDRFTAFPRDSVSMFREYLIDDLRQTQQKE